MQVIDRNLTVTQVAMIIQNTTEERTILQHLKGNTFPKTENTEIEASVFLSAKSQIFFYQVFLLRASIPLGTVQLLFFCLLTDFSSAFLTSLPPVHHFFFTLVFLYMTIILYLVLLSRQLSSLILINPLF